MGCCFLLQGIFLTQGSILCLLHLQADSLPLSPQGSPSGLYPPLPLPFWIQTALNLRLFSPTEYILGISILLLIVTYCILFNDCAIFVIWMCRILFNQNTMDGQLVAQSCPTLWDPLDHSSLGSSAHGISRQDAGVGCHLLLQGIFPTQGLNLGLPHCRQIHLSHLLFIKNIEENILGSLSVYSLKKCWLRGYEKFFHFW